VERPSPDEKPENRGEKISPRRAARSGRDEENPELERQRILGFGLVDRRAAAEKHEREVEDFKRR